jgi:hypothetical protein
MVKQGQESDQSYAQGKEQYTHETIEWFGEYIFPAKVEDIHMESAISIQHWT